MDENDVDPTVDDSPDPAEPRRGALLTQEEWEQLDLAFNMAFSTAALRNYGYRTLTLH